RIRSGIRLFIATEMPLADGSEKRHLQTISAPAQGVLEGSNRPMSRPSPSPSRTSGRRRVACLGILAILALSVAALCWRFDGFAARQARTVRLALERGRIDEAALALERWLQTAPDSADAHYFKARIAWIEHDLPTVDQELARAEKLGYTWHQL